MKDGPIGNMEKYSLPCLADEIAAGRIPEPPWPTEPPRDPPCKGDMWKRGEDYLIYINNEWMRVE